MSTHPQGPPALPRYVLHSLGCKVSRAEGAALSALLARAGLAPADAPDRPSVVVVHGCAVTARAERDARRLLRRVRREAPGAATVVSGCLAERDPRALAGLDEVDLVVGFAALRTLPALLAARAAGLLPGKVVGAPSGEGGPDAPLGLPAADADAPLGAFVDAGRTRAFLKVQDGCDRRCAFCVVPSLRGGERSAACEDVEDAVRRLGDAGIPEVVLVGVHLASFGRGTRGGRLADLLRRLERHPPACRIRLSSLEPMEAGEAVVDLVAGSAVVVPHLHLPLQSGSDAVLRRMRRGLTVSRFVRLAERAVRNPRLHLATDVIAGFPGETEEEFHATETLLASLPFASAHVFPFSPRPGTAGELLHRERGVPPAVAERRAARLRRQADAGARAFRSRASGTEAEVVALRGGRGLTDHYLEVALEAGPEGPPPPGTRFRARLVPGADGELVAVGGPPPGRAGALLK